MEYQRTNPISGREVDRRTIESLGVSAGEDQMGTAEAHSATDPAGFVRLFIGHHHVGGYLHHGTVATAAALLTLDRPYSGHACFPGDTAIVEATASLYRCKSNHGGSAEDWDLVGVVSPSADAISCDVGGLNATTVEAALEELAAKTLTEDAESNGVSLIASTPFGIRKLIAGTGITLTALAGAVQINAEGVGGNPVTGTSSTVFAGIESGAITSEVTGWGWISDGLSYSRTYPYAWDGFVGIPSGNITQVTTGDNWLSDGTTYQR